MAQKKEKGFEFDYSNMAEKIYSRSFIAVCCFILIAFFIIWTTGASSDITTTFKSILSFIEHVLWIYAVPVSIQIAGDRFATILRYLKGR
jgi:meiotically up-regulated gene 157 (Mug157) protein